MNGPLSGFRIIDLSSVLSGPAATVLLADQGADVVKVESPTGDIVRRMGRGHDGLSPAFVAANRGKRSVCLNSKNQPALISSNGWLLMRMCLFRIFGLVLSSAWV